jgi:hypothetical protein
MQTKMEKALDKVMSTGLELTGYGFSQQEATILVAELKNKYKRNKEKIHLRINS